MKEVWKPIPGYPGYDVSDQGRVRSYRRRGSSWYIADKPQRFLKPSVDRGKYPGVNLQINTASTFHRISALVLLAFVGPPPKGLKIQYKNHRTTNVCLDNLFYAKGQHHNGTIERVLGIRYKRRAGETVERLSSEYDLVPSYIKDICWGRVFANIGGPLEKVPEKFSALDVMEIRLMRSLGETITQLARKYHCHQSTISRISTGSRHPKVGGPLTFGRQHYGMG